MMILRPLLLWEFRPLSLSPSPHMNRGKRNGEAQVFIQKSPRSHHQHQTHWPHLHPRRRNPVLQSRRALLQLTLPLLHLFSLLIHLLWPLGAPGEPLPAPIPRGGFRLQRRVHHGHHHHHNHVFYLPRRRPIRRSECHPRRRHMFHEVLLFTVHNEIHHGGG